MNKKTVPEIAVEIHALVKDLSPQEFLTLMKVIYTFQGLEHPSETQKTILSSPQEPISEVIPTKNHTKPHSHHLDTPSAGDYFAEKCSTKALSKVEKLGVIARYLDKYSKISAPTKEQFSQGFDDAGQLFDGPNFTADIKNARNQLGLFTQKTNDGGYSLTHFGKLYIDHLPDFAKAKEFLDKAKQGLKQKAKNKKKKASESKGTPEQP